MTVMPSSPAMRPGLGATPSAPAEARRRTLAGSASSWPCPPAPASTRFRQRLLHGLHADLRPGLHRPTGSGASCPRGSGSARRASPTRISSAATRPLPSFVGSSICVDDAVERLRPACARTCGCCAGGNTSTMRSIGLGRARSCAAWRTRGARSRRPSARALIVSRSRSSPTRMTSGSSRSAARSAAANDCVCGADLALVDEAPLRLVHELDRVLEREDVLRRVALM